MKKTVACVLFVLVALAVSADGFLDDFRDGKNYVPDHVALYTGNDLFSYGITRNDDDQLSYSFDFQVEAPLWFTRFNLNGITNRGWRDGWDMRDYSKEYDEGADVRRGRYDSLEGVVGLKLRPLEEEVYLHLYPEIGLALVGDYGWVWAQNLIHRMGGIHEVDLPYDNDGAKSAHMMLGTRVNIGFKLFDFERSSVIVEAEAYTKNILGVQSDNYAVLRASISTPTHDLVGFHAGYMLAEALTDSPTYTQELYLRYLNGWRIGLTVDTGIVFIKYSGNLETNYGFGYMGFDVMGFFEPRRWEETDVYLRISKASLFGHYYNALSLGCPVYDRLQLILKNSYLSGQPLSPKEEAEADLNVMERFKQNYSFFTVGVRFTLPELFGDYINPYLEISAGLQRFSVYLLNNQIEDPEYMIEKTPSLEVLEPAGFDTIYGLISLEGGIGILPESLVVFQDTSLQLEMFGGCNVILGGNTDEITIYRFINEFWETMDWTYMEDMGWKARFVPYFGIGIRFGFDL